MNDYLLSANGKPPDITLIPKQKSPIEVVDLQYLGNGEWEVMFFRREKPAKMYHASSSPISFLICVIKELELLDLADIMPNSKGWTAYIKPAVYPPPSISSDEPSEKSYSPEQIKEAAEKLFDKLEADDKVSLEQFTFFVCNFADFTELLLFGDETEEDEDEEVSDIFSLFEDKEAMKNDPRIKPDRDDHPCRCADTGICPKCEGDTVNPTPYGGLGVCDICDGKGDCPYCRPGGA